MDGGCVGASRRIVVVDENQPLVTGVQALPQLSIPLVYKKITLAQSFISYESHCT